MATLAVTQRRSGNGANQRQLDTLRSLGLRRIGHTVLIADCEQARGMLHAVRHLVEVRTPQQKPPAKRTRDEKAAKSPQRASKQTSAEESSA